LQNIRPVTVISAVKLNSTQQNTIVEKLANKLNKKILPNWEINKDIIAGIMIKIDDNVLDMSLKNRIEKLGKSLMLK
jgi:F-type H+-transporting ATPase subunit delta